MSTEASVLPEEYTRAQVDDQPLSPVDEAKGKLDKLLSSRSTEKELVDKNIIKDTKVAPALQAAQTELKRKQTADKLGEAIAHRPPAEELVKEGILAKDEAPETPTGTAGTVDPPSIA